MADIFNRLEPQNKTYDIQDGLQARVKDPLWMLGRQWQVGEFMASNGGQPIRMEATYTTATLKEIVKGKEGTEKPIETSVPLEKYVEEETEEESAWDPKHLEYSFKVKNSELELHADEYDGNRLDWFHFDISENSSSFGESQKVSVIPNPVKYYGMPSSRWWSHEDGQINLGDFSRPHFNILTMLLIEYGLIFSQDWYCIPVEHKVGDIRKMSSVVVIDSFGVHSEVAPTRDETAHNRGFELFTLSPKENNDSNSTLFYFPNSLSKALESKPLEEISFFRDEVANLVWAIEHRYEKNDGKIVQRHEVETEQNRNLKPRHYWDKDQKKLIEEPESFEEGEPGNKIEGPIPLYVESQVPPRHWIPYVQQHRNHEIVLRRARTYDNNEDQYKGKILKESALVAEEEIPRAGIKVSRIRQLARKSSTGNIIEWTGRVKRVDHPQPFSRLAFDQLIER